MTRWRAWLPASGLMLALAATVLEAAAAEALSAAAQRGAAIYRDGMLPSGLALSGARADGTTVTGRAAACISCHRASGMGGAEGAILVPPVQAALLFAPGQRKPGRQPRVARGLQLQLPKFQTRPAYDLQSLQLALNQGRSADGTALGSLMPRYAISTEDNANLAAYLASLQSGNPPGLQGQPIHLASVIDGDASPRRRQALLDTLSACLGPEDSAAPEQPHAQIPLIWHQWHVNGEPSTWPEQLARHQQRQPVFALVSGLSDRAWQPVQQFCESEQMPCLLPNAPGVDPAQPGNWSFHFSRGVALEASLIETDLRLAALGGSLLQLVDGSEAAAMAARVLAERIGDLKLTNQIRMLDDNRETSLATGKMIAALQPGDQLVLWLGPAELAALTAAWPPPVGVTVYLSGELGGLDAVPLAPAWREQAKVAYAYQAADRRIGRQILNAGTLLRAQGDAIKADLVLLQGNSYSACEMSVRSLRVMGEQVSRRWLLELFEAADESALATGYPRFTLGPGQRVGSRGGHLMRFDPQRPTRLQPISDWIVPDWAEVEDARP